MQAVIIGYVWVLWGMFSVFSFNDTRSHDFNAGTKTNGLHPFHVSVTDINHNKAESTLELQCKIFTDDFEAALAKTYQRKTDLINPAMHPSMDTLVRQYVLTHLQVKANGIPLSPKYLGFEQEKEAVYVFVEYVKAPTVLKEAVVVNSLLYELYTDQINIIHCKTGEKTKSVKLDYPEKNAHLVFP